MLLLAHIDVITVLCPLEQLHMNINSKALELIMTTSSGIVNWLQFTEIIQVALIIIN